MRFAILVALALLAGCSGDTQDKKVAKKLERKEAAEAMASKTPTPRTINVNGNQLVVVDVANADGSGYVDVQKCYIWRDAEYKTSSMQCPSEGQSVEIPGGPTYDHH